MRDIFEEEILAQLSSDFALWAFGEGFEHKSSQDLMQAWNDLHGHQYLLEAHEMISYSAPKMVALWKKETMKS